MVILPGKLQKVSIDWKLDQPLKTVFLDILTLKEQNAPNKYFRLFLTVTLLLLPLKTGLTLVMGLTLN